MTAANINLGNCVCYKWVCLKFALFIDCYEDHGLKADLITAVQIHHNTVNIIKSHYGRSRIWDIPLYSALVLESFTQTRSVVTGYCSAKGAFNSWENGDWHSKTVPSDVFMFSTQKGGRAGLSRCHHTPPVLQTQNRRPVPVPFLP